MVGVSGVLGPDAALPEAMAEWTTHGDEETTVRFAADDLEFQLTNHSLLTGDQPVTATGPEGSEVLIWVWGDVYGHGTGEDYEPRAGPPDGSARFVADLYADLGMGFADDLNGDFAVLVYDEAEHTLSFVTDLLASRPFYVARPDDETTVFASNLQALPRHDAVEPALDPDYLQEYLQLRRVFGVETPLTGVRELPPASVVTVDLDDGATTTRSYWEPTYDPQDRSFSAFATELADRLETVLAEWTQDDLDYGVLLSGGSDSRLVEAAIDQDVVSYHNADWMSREAKVAREVSETAGNEFRLLERYDDHEARSLESTPELSNFSGWFDQAYFSEFEDQITNEVDVLVSGLFADMLFAGGPLSTRSLSLGPIGTMSLPVRDPIDDLDDYVAAQTETSRPLPYFRSDRPVTDVVRDNLRDTGDGVVSHGLEYGSLTDLVMYGDYYPLGADTEAIFSRSLMQMRPYRTPFLDRRIIELASQIPMAYFLRRNLINAAVEELSPELADIPHARSGVSLKHSFPVEYVGTNLNGFGRKYVYEEPTPEPYLDHKPWPDRRELLRANPFAIETIRDNAGLLRSLPRFDYEGAERTYRQHLDGQDNHTVLYSLLTVLEMPLTEMVEDTTGHPTDRPDDQPSGSEAVVSPGDAGSGPTGHSPPNEGDG
ncbi:asparagine synthase-related protein [Halobacteriales archaeon Cl-PHB]